MLTRLKVDGFKNLLAADVSFGPFTCIAGANGVGKSNLFDAIRFLSMLADKPLLEAAALVRGEPGGMADLRGLFQRYEGAFDAEMSFEAEMLVPPEGIDDLGQPAKAAITFLKYRLVLKLDEGDLTVREESLTHVNVGEARKHLPFDHSTNFRRSVVEGRRTSPFISTSEENGQTVIRLHQDQGAAYKGGGKPRPHIARKLPRTVLSTVNAAEGATAVMARREMQAWRLLQLEPAALRSPDAYTAPTFMTSSGAHLPATLARLTRWRNPLRPNPAGSSEDDLAITAGVANRLAELISGVRSVRVDSDDRRELLRIMLTDGDGIEHEARALSDGTLRFLALAVLESDPAARGVLCLEEPENGIHPERVPAMIELLRDLAVDPEERVSADNPLRQVIVNTHSPTVVGQVDEDDLLVAVPEHVQIGRRTAVRPSFRWLAKTWRSKAWPELPALAPGVVVSYLNPVPPVPDSGPSQPAARQRRRVIDRPDLLKWLPFGNTTNPA